MESCTGADGHRWEIWQSANGWRWRRIARNGVTVAASTQGYANKSDCIANARLSGMQCTPR